jgi:hypothetical protein
MAPPQPWAEADVTAPQRDRIDRVTRLDGAVPAYRRRARSERAGSGSVAQRITAMAIGAFFLAFLVTFGLATVTSAATAERIITRSVPALTEVDRLLSIHLADMQATAKSSGQGVISLPGFPVAAGLTPAEVSHDSAATLQLLLDKRAATAIYERGAVAFKANGGQTSGATGPLFSGGWAMHEVLSVLNARDHARFQRYAFVFGALTLAMLAVLCLQVGGFGRLVGAGAAGLVGAVLAGLATFFVWLLVQFSYSGASSPVGSAAWGMIADAAWTMVLIDAVALAACFAILVAGVAFATVDREPIRASESALPFEQRGRRHRPLD